MKPRLILLITAAFIVGVLGAFTSFYLVGAGMKQYTSKVTVTGKARVGGPFTLTNHKGQRVTRKDFAGRYMLVYFGYTFCPDVCPIELQVITKALEQLGDKAAKVTPVFITVDPERDTVKQMASYVTHFHDRLVGLTGSVDEIRAIAKSYHVYFAKAKDNNSSTEYTIDHTSLIYFMSPKGDYLAHFAYGTDPKKMAEKLAKFL